MRNLRLALLSVLAIVVCIIALQNTEPVETRILFATVEMPRALLLLTSTLVGFALGILAALLWMRPRKAGPGDKA